MDFNNEIKEMDLLEKACLKYNLDKYKTRKITGGYQSLVYGYDNKYILRITPSFIRSYKMILSELDWCLYLFNKGISLSKPVSSPNNLLAERINISNITYTITLFEKAKGKKLTYDEYLGKTDIYFKLRKKTGLIHKYSKKYKPQRSKRHNYLDNYYIKNAKNFLPESQMKIYNTLYNVLDNINKYQKDVSNYGLIHGDINVGNFHYNNGSITLFDFDEAQYSFYIEDIAIQLFYTVYVFGDDCIDLRYKNADEFMTFFLDGYTNESSLDKNIVEKTVNFLILREIILHIAIYKKWDLNNLNPWQKGYYLQSKKRLENSKPLVDLDKVI